jgi:sec-independent protein translocase protein TatC
MKPELPLTRRSIKNPLLKSTKKLEVEDGHIMSVIEHLDELRNRVIRCALFIAGACFIMLFFSKQIVRILEAPAAGIQFQALSLEEPLLVYFKVTFYCALILSLPYILWEVSQFVSPGLKPLEKRVLSPIIIGGPILFMCGATFAYFFVLPPMLHFFSAFGKDISPINQRLDFYISLTTTVLLYMGLCFQLPVVIFALSFTGLVNSTMLIKVWKYAVFSASLIAAIITPDPTAISMMIVFAALVSLYFVSVGLLKIFGR